MIDHKDLTPNFRHVWLVLAREKGHPEGDAKEGYDLLVPLDSQNRIDAKDWKTHQAVCRVRRLDETGDDRIGRLRRKPGGEWYFDYAEGESDDAIGFRLGEERFVVGEYVSIGRGTEMHTYQVARADEP